MYSYQQEQDPAAEGQFHNFITKSFNNSKSYPPPQAQYHEIVQNPDLFMQNLRSFHFSFGTKFKIPTVGGSRLDLHRLFVEVTSRGGIEKVIRERKWKDVSGAFSFPPSITSASFVLRNHYLSLLYHFEQVYYFRKGHPSARASDPAVRPVNGSAIQLDFSNFSNVNKRLETCNLEAGSSVCGTIDAKFDYGYLVTVNVGTEKLKGVLYHSPTVPCISDISPIYETEFSPRERKKYHREVKDPSRPKPNRSGYTFFFSEQHLKLKDMYHGQVKAISKKIGSLWNNLSEAEKQIYQDKANQDKERYRMEMVEYNTSHFPHKLDQF